MDLAGDGMSNFHFLKSKWPDLGATGRLAEEYLYSDPNAAIFKTRLFAEKLIDLVLVVYKIHPETDLNFSEKIHRLSRVERLNPAVIDLFTLVRKLGNKAAHENFGNTSDARECIKSIFKLSAWFFVKVTGMKSAVPKPFVWPSPAKAKQVPKSVYLPDPDEKSEVQTGIHQEEVGTLQKQMERYPGSTDKTEKEADAIANELEIDEAKTRKLLIDVLLKEAGWDLDNPDQVRAGYEVKPHPNPSGKGYADYVLFDKVGKPVAVIEAKKTAVDPEIGKHEARQYADSLEVMFQVRPVIFYTNGHETWIWDDQVGPPRRIWSFYTLEDLEFLHLQHQNRKPLRTVQLDQEIAGRAYQIEGIKRVYEAYESGNRRALMVMATGSGKTRTAIALVKGMLQTGWVKRVLFLADRDELVDQAMRQKNSFQTFLPQSPRMRITAATVGERKASIYFATYQTMVKYYDRFSVGFFDLVIADESHRSIYKTYRDVLEYFDAYLLGLTATPVDFINRNTFRLFDCPNGDPTFHYSYQEAYHHIPPYLLRYQALEVNTKFLRQGIHWKELTEEQKREIEEDGLAEELIDFDRDQLEVFITNRDTNKFIIQTLMNQGIKVGDTIGKTIIFARNTNHATLLLKLFDELYPQYHGKMAAVIHSKVVNHEDLLNQFKEEDRPRIAISVDMLDTGVDVPEVVNLSFAKPVYSKVKFLQMMGRGTRLCPDLFGKGQDKKTFIIFDHWENFKFFEMNPEGDLPTESKSSMQVRFELRIALLEHFQKQNGSKNQAELIRLLREDIAALPERSVEIKKHWKTLTYLKQDPTWRKIDAQLLNVLKLEIAPLMQWIDIEGHLDAVWFDNEMHRIELSLLKHDTAKLEKQVRSVIDEFDRLKLHLNQFNAVRPYIERLKQFENWSDMGFKELEECRSLLRELMRLRGNTLPGTVIPLNITDDEKRIRVITEPSGEPVLHMDEYLKRVETALQNELQMQLVIYKIRKGQTLTEFDEATIFQIFDQKRFDFTLEELATNVHVKKSDLSGLLRRFVGVDEAELNERFRLFLLSHPGIAPAQIKILAMIKNDIIQNKGISFASLYEGAYAAFSNQGIDGVFEPRMTEEVFALIQPYKFEEESYG
jgi:type I restriction enzyme R subunit